MAVLFFVDIVEVPHDIPGRIKRVPDFDLTTGESWGMLELRNGKGFVRMNAASIPEGGQPLGSISSKDDIVSDANANAMRTYFGLTPAQGQELRGMRFGRAIYHLMLEKPASRHGVRQLAGARLDQSDT